MSWDGPERRRMSEDSRELLQKMAVKQAEIANDVKHMVKWSETHDSDDTKRFEKMEKSLAWQNKILYGALAIIAFVGFMAPFVEFLARLIK